MLMILSDYLNVKNSIKYYNRDPYSGVCLEVDDEGIVKALTLYEDGKEISEYYNKYLNLSKFKKVDSDILEYRQSDNSEAQKVFFYDSEFSGIAYSFEHGICSEEVLYINGDLKTEFIYYKNGEIAEINSYKDEFNYIRIRFSEKRQLIELTIEGCFYDKEEGLSENHFFPEKEFFLDVESSYTLNLKGENIDDELFSNIFSNNGMRKLRKLMLERTSISKNNLDRLENLENFEILLENGIETYSSRVIEEKNDTKKNLCILFSFMAIIFSLFKKIPYIFSEINSYDLDHAGVQTIILFSFFIIVSGITSNINQKVSGFFFITGSIISNIIMIYILFKTGGGIDFDDVLGMLILVNIISVGMLTFLIIHDPTVS